jgi:hypothetical protein
MKPLVCAKVDCKQRQKLLMDLLSDESFDVVEGDDKTTTETARPKDACKARTE